MRCWRGCSRPTRTTSRSARSCTPSSAPTRRCRAKWRWRPAAAPAIYRCFSATWAAGMLDGCAVGDVFASPSADTMLTVTKAHQRRQGRRLHLRQLRRRQAELRHGRRDGRPGGHPRPHRHREGRRGLRPGGRGRPAARRGRHDLRLQVRRREGRAGRLAGRSRGRRGEGRWPTRGRWAWPCRRAPCRWPGKPTFTIGDDEMEIGMGIHGEPGVKREKLQPADQVAERMATTHPGGPCR